MDPTLEQLLSELYLTAAKNVRLEEENKELRATLAARESEDTKEE